MRVLHFSKYYSKGGASLAALDSVRGQREAGIDAILCVGRRSVDAPDWVIQPSKLGDIGAVANFAIERLPSRLSSIHPFDTRSIGWVGIDGARLARKLRADLCVLHNVDGLLPIENLAEFDVPLVWRTHDMWAMCGSEHYTSNPAPYRVAIQESAPDWISRWVFARKLKYIRPIKDLTICSPSNWLADEFRQSALFQGRDVHVVANGIDIDLFTPIERLNARAALGLETDRPILLFGSAGGTDDPRKGFDLLLGALRRLNMDMIEGATLVTFGGGEVPNLGMPAVNLGKIRERERLNLLYSAANVMIVPSRMENLSLTVLEALASGTPVIAFDIGGMPDMILQGQTGWLVPPFDIEALAQSITEAVKSCDEQDDMRMRCRSIVEKQFSRQVEAKAMACLFARVLECNRDSQKRNRA
jgi:glycosyltransferase involved in cell wall biosynthesis